MTAELTRHQRRCANNIGLRMDQMARELRALSSADAGLNNFTVSQQLDIIYEEVNSLARYIHLLLIEPPVPADDATPLMPVCLPVRVDAEVQP